MDARGGCDDVGGCFWMLLYCLCSVGSSPACRTLTEDITKSQLQVSMSLLKRHQSDDVDSKAKPCFILHRPLPNPMLSISHSRAWPSFAGICILARQASFTASRIGCKLQAQIAKPSVTPNQSFIASFSAPVALPTGWLSASPRAAHVLR